MKTNKIKPDLLLEHGYQFATVINGDNRNTIVYKALKGQNSIIAVKKPKKRNPGEKHRLRYRNEFEILKHLKLRHIIKAYDLVEVKGVPHLILEYFEGKEIYLHFNGNQFSFIPFLRAASMLADAVLYLHNSGIVHKNICPMNILADDDLNNIRLIDFDLSGNLEASSAKSVDVIEGHLEYMSPEQTGKVNKPVDHRSDLYSLGCTLYHLLLNRPPFSYKKSVDILNAHVSRIPVPPHREDRKIPGMISRIVMKLLEKNPDARYQSAGDLKTDLDACLHHLESNGRIPDFELSSSAALHYMDQLYERDSEIKTIHDAVDGVIDGDKSVLFISGPPGVGKTVLIQKAFESCSRKNVRMIYGKFDQRGMERPYSALIESIEDLIFQYLSEKDGELKNKISHIEKEMGSHMSALVKLAPVLKKMISPEENDATLDPYSEKIRLSIAFHTFIDVITTQNNALIMFLDDVQWIDNESEELVKSLVLKKNIRSKNISDLMLIFAYRDTEINGDHFIGRIKNIMKQSGAPYENIHLKPFSSDTMQNIFSHIFGESREENQKIVSLLNDKTGGNPFHLKQYLDTLRKSGLIFHENNKWSFHESEIRQMDISDNLAGLLAGRMALFGKDVQTFLKTAACFGKEFNHGMIRYVTGLDETTLTECIDISINENLIIPKQVFESHSENRDKTEERGYKFLHDKIQEAAYNLIPDNDKPEFHFHIGKILLNHPKKKFNGGGLLETVAHLNYGVHFSLNDDDRQVYARLNLDAGRAAKKASAFKKAQYFFGSGLAFIRDDFWDKNYHLSFDLHKDMGEILLINAEMYESEKILNKTTAKAKSNGEKAEILLIQVLQYTQTAQFKKALEYGKNGLELLGMTIPEKPSPEKVDKMIQKLGEKYGEIEIRNSLGKKTPPGVIGEKCRLAHETAIAAYYQDQSAYKYMICMVLDEALAYRPTEETLIAYFWYAVFQIKSFKNYNFGFQLSEQCIQTSETFNNPILLNRDYSNSVSYINHLFKPLTEGIDLFTKAYNTAVLCGDYQFAGLAYYSVSLSMFVAGTPLYIIYKKLTQCDEILRQTYNTFMMLFKDGMELICANLLGETKDRFCFDLPPLMDEEYSNRIQKSGCFTSIMIYFGMKGQIYYLFGEYEKAAAFFEKIPKVDMLLCFPFENENFCYHALTLLALYPGATPEEREEILKKVDDCLVDLQEWGVNCPTNYDYKLFLVLAEKERILGNEDEALGLYNKVIAITRKKNFYQGHALANELAGKYWYEKGDDEFAQLHIQKAYKSYRKWGAARKAEDVMNSYPHFFQPQNDLSKKIDTGVSLRGIHVEDMDVHSLIKASRGISGALKMDELINVLLVTVIQNTGAEKACLVINEKDNDDNEHLMLKAFCRDSGDEIETDLNLPVDESEIIPQMIIRNTFRIREPIFFSSESNDKRFSQDVYIMKNKIKSAVCHPIIHKDKIIGVLYLENNLIPTLFIETKSEVLKALVSQIAVSLQNAFLFSEVKETQKLLEESEKRYRELMENIPLIACSLDKRGRVAAVNRNQIREYGYEPEDLMGKHFGRFIYGEDKEKLKSEIKKLNNSEKDRDINSIVRFITKRGKAKWGDVRIRPAQEDTSESPNVFVVIQDITKRLEMEKQLVESGKYASLGQAVSRKLKRLRFALNSILKQINKFDKDNITPDETMVHIKNNFMKLKHGFDEIHQLNTMGNHLNKQFNMCAFLEHIKETFNLNYREEGMQIILRRSNGKCLITGGMGDLYDPFLTLFGVIAKKIACLEKRIITVSSYKSRGKVMVEIVFPARSDNNDEKKMIFNNNGKNDVSPVPAKIISAINLYKGIISEDYNKRHRHAIITLTFPSKK